MPGDHGRRSGPRRTASLAESRKPEKSLGGTCLCRGWIRWRGDQRAAYEASRIRLSVVKRSDRQIKAFIMLPKRWIVERTLGWVNRARRLAQDVEAMLNSSQAWFMVALGFLLVRRTARDYKSAA